MQSLKEEPCWILASTPDTDWRSDESLRTVVESSDKNKVTSVSNIVAADAYYVPL